MTDYGRHLGIAYQLVDDALDYSASSEALGKNIGADLAEGKPTLPLLYALWHCPDKQALLIRRAIKQGSLEDIEQISAAIAATGAIQYTRDRARQEADLAMRALNSLPQSGYLDALFTLAHFATERNY